MSLTPSVLAVMVVRDEAPFLETNIRHHRSLGVERFLVIDNGSRDATPEVLERLSRSCNVYWRRFRGVFNQSRLLTTLAREAARLGAQWVLPIDTDEFWMPEGTSLPELLSSVNPTIRALSVNLVTFVQRREEVATNPSSLAWMTERPARTYGPPRRAQHLVSSGVIAYMEAAYPPKLVSRARPTLEIGMGNHTSDAEPAEIRKSHRLVCLHAPLRSFSELERKMADHGRRARALRLPPHLWWHARRWGEMADDPALVRAEWQANSYADGKLGIGRTGHLTRTDLRLQQCVSPWLN